MLESPYAGPREVAGFEVIREIGAGGMGIVYEAIEQKMHRRVALKVLSRRLSPSEKANVRFEREAWIAGRLSHPNLVKVFERGDWLDTSFYTMELVDGGSLQDVIARMRKGGRDEARGLQFGTREHIAWVITQVAAAARALDYAHRQGVVHRDIKPMNILLARDPCAVKIADFGVAIDMEASRMTTTGAIIGTVAYMAPEQIRGDVDRIDGRCDIYALGVTLFELLTLELPHTGATQQMYMNSVLTGQARHPSRLNERVSRDLDVVLSKALEKDPKDRYATAAAFADDLDNVLAFRPIRAKPPSTAAKVAKWIRRKPINAALIVALVVGAPTISMLAVRSFQQHRLLDRAEVEGLWSSARRLSQGERYREAVAMLSQILERRPGHTDALQARALARYNLARDATQPAGRADLEKGSLADATRLIELLPQASWPYRLRAFLLKSFGRESEAATDREKGEKRRPVAADKEELKFDGLLALESKDYATAVDLLTRLITIDPGNVDARLNRGAAYQFLGRIDKARTDYEVVAGLAPSHPIPQYSLGRLLTLDGSLDEGAAHYEQALRLDPDNPHIHTGLADNLIRQGGRKATAGEGENALADFKRAEAEARKAIEIDPDLTWAHLNLGFTLREKYRILGSSDGDLLDQAIAEYERVIAIWRASGSDPKDEVYSKALANQCDALIFAGAPGRALESCRAAMDARPDDPLNHYNLAGAYALLGRKDEALEALRRDVDLGDRDFEYLSSDRWFESLRRDSRFSALLNRMKSAPPP